jgi:hypothetical protein
MTPVVDSMIGHRAAGMGVPSRHPRESGDPVRRGHCGKSQYRRVARPHLDRDAGGYWVPAFARMTIGGVERGSDGRLFFPDAGRARRPEEPVRRHS